LVRQVPLELKAHRAIQDLLARKDFKV